MVGYLTFWVTIRPMDAFIATVAQGLLYHLMGCRPGWLMIARISKMLVPQWINWTGRSGVARRYGVFTLGEAERKLGEA
ncbi:hypothetical protein ACQPW1_21760 [Nocardia sp. CA-128927]|uniref:hypothetical protein n=1 Tax=Nocardia sp. CA-128927 TaxID=3239975 RepID=UPI003D97D054